LHKKIEQDEQSNGMSKSRKRHSFVDGGSTFYGYSKLVRFKLVFNTDLLGFEEIFICGRYNNALNVSLRS
jgi:hypothetical protein